jgi:hypothetical protein
MVVRRWVTCSFVALSALTAVACGSDTSPSSAPTSASHSATTSAAESVAATPTSSAETTTALSTAYTAPTTCLMTVEDVSSVLGGTWDRSDNGAGNCIYQSDRGAMFAIVPIDAPPSDQEPSLADARIHNCATQPRDVPDTGGAFVCIERPLEGDVVEGNIIGQGYLWVVVMQGQGSDPSYPAQSDAMAALLSAVRR